jgi:cysteamine dioxygenase
MAVAFPPHIMLLSKVQHLYDACDVIFTRITPKKTMS